MNKSIEFTQSQIKAYENNATMFIVPITNKTIIDTIESNINNTKVIETLIKVHAPIQKGDKDIFIKEEFIYGEVVCYNDGCCIEQTELCKEENKILYLSDIEHIKKDGIIVEEELIIESSYEMTKEQSRYTISECIGGRAVRVQDIINGSEIQDINPFLLNFKMFIHFYNNQLKEQNINRTYDDNDYILLLEVKR